MADNVRALAEHLRKIPSSLAPPLDTQHNHHPPRLGRLAVAHPARQPFPLDPDQLAHPGDEWLSVNRWTLEARTAALHVHEL